MATVRAEIFDAEMFGKTVALFDSNNAGEAENAFRKAVLMCAKNGLRFCEAAGMAFGQGDGGEVADLQEQLQRQEAEHANQLTEAAAEINRLRAELAGGTPEGEHVIDLPGRLRHAWGFPQFRLFVLTVMIGAGVGFADAHSNGLAAVSRWLCLVLFGAWSLAQFRKRGIGQMFLKWLVYLLTIWVCGAVGQGVGIYIDEGPIGLVVLIIALVLTLSRVSEWLGEKVRAHVWESNPVHVVRAWF